MGPPRHLGHQLACLAQSQVVDKVPVIIGLTMDVTLFRALCFLERTPSCSPIHPSPMSFQTTGRAPRLTLLVCTTVGLRLMLSLNPGLTLLSHSLHPPPRSLPLSSCPSLPSRHPLHLLLSVLNASSSVSSETAVMHRLKHNRRRLVRHTSFYSFLHDGHCCSGANPRYPQ